MAFALILRNTTRISVVSNILKGSSVQMEPRTWFTQLSNKPNIPKLNKILSSKTNYFDGFLKRPMSGNHAKMWPLEKLVTVSLLGLIPATFVVGNKILDDIFSVIVCLHMHWGLEGCAIDYIRPIIFGAAIPKLAILLLYIVTLSTLASLIYYNHFDIGIGCTFQKLWELDGSLDD